MWFMSIDKVQFKMYVRQDARINGAYWLATKAIYMRETLPSTKSLDARLSFIRYRIRKLLSLAHEDLPSQAGVTKRLIQQKLEFTTSHCVDCIETLNGKESSSYDEQMARELKYIRDRADIMPGDDLIEEWDRGIYLIYQAMATHGEGDTSKAVQSGIAQRMNAACELMEPGFAKIQRHCDAYINQINLGSAQRRQAINQQIVDYSALFSVGLRLAKFSQTVINNVDRLKTEPVDEAKTAKLSANINQEGDALQAVLIEKSLARTENLRKLLDQECYTSLPKPVQTT
ncbi:MAG: Uncharacterised protein [Porticoccaceae bacterium UBA1117]|nr:MAG: Uncharacterised protein [Porticoccaceae bacterium UBA1117]